MIIWVGFYNITIIKKNHKKLFANNIYKINKKPAYILAFYLLFIFSMILIVKKINLARWLVLSLNDILENSCLKK